MAEAFYRAGNHGVLLADEPGLGKTVQALMLADRLNAVDTLVVCPSAVKINWMREVHKWMPNPPFVNILEGRKADTFTAGFQKLDIINYDILSYIDFSKCRYDLIVYDESHLLKTPEAKRTIAAATIPAGRRLLLTGTPIINRPKEIYQQLVLCGVAKPEHFHQFGLKYCNAWRTVEPRTDRHGNTEMQDVWNYDGHKNLEELNYHLRNMCMIRRRKADVLPDLPSKTRQVIELPWQKSDLNALKALDFKKGCVSEDELNIAFEQIALVRHETAIEKIGPAVKFVRDLVLPESEKLVLFAYHLDLIGAVADELERYGVSVVKGGMTAEQKQAAVDRFVNEPSCRILLGQINAVGTGVDGLQRVCSRAIFLELDWSPGTMTQCEDRLHRIGQEDENILIQYLVFSGSIDCRIANRLLEKQDVLEKATFGNTSVDWAQELMVA
jgi:SWI/SNF-related matrix-associated actin-dependent regulator 1 of chromatin subfamily A